MNEEQARQWVQDILDVAARGAALTGTTLDDKAIIAMSLAVDNDVVWGWVWAILRRALEGDRVMSLQTPPEVEAETDKVEVDPLMIIAIINAVVELIKIWRNRHLE